MLPTISVQSDRILIAKPFRRGRGITTGDIVSIRHPLLPSEGAVKRVVGMGGDFVLRDTPASLDTPHSSLDSGTMMIQVCLSYFMGNGGEREERGRKGGERGEREPPPGREREKGG